MIGLRVPSLRAAGRAALAAGSLLVLAALLASAVLSVEHAVRASRLAAAETRALEEDRAMIPLLPRLKEEVPRLRSRLDLALAAEAAPADAAGLADMLGRIARESGAALTSFTPPDRSGKPGRAELGADFRAQVEVLRRLSRIRGIAVVEVASDVVSGKPRMTLVFSVTERQAGQKAQGR